MKRILAIIAVTTLVLIFTGCKLTEEPKVSEEQVDYDKAMSDAGTYNDCRYFINTYPNSKHIGEVTSKAEKLANSDNAKLKTVAPDLTEGQINQLTMDLLGKLQNNNINQVILYLNNYKLKVPKSWVGESIKDQKENFIDKIGKKIESEFQKFVINQANCGIPERNKIDSVMKEISKLLDNKFSQEDAVKKLGQFEVADAFIFFDMTVTTVDKKNLEKPFLTGTCHEVEFTYNITAKLVPVASASAIWVQDLEFKHKTYIWNSSKK